MHPLRPILRLFLLTLAALCLALPALAQGPLKVLQNNPHEKAAIITLKGEIDYITAESIKRRVQEAGKAGASLIVLEIDSPGGLLDATLDITKFIKNWNATPNQPPIVAWINPKAYSGGAIIALAAAQRVMAPSAAMGDAAPIMVVGDHAAAVPEDLLAKARSPLLEDLEDSAKRNNFPVLLGFAMVVPEIVVWKIQDKQTGDIRFVDEGEKDRLLKIMLERPDAAPNQPAEPRWAIVDADPTDGDLDPVDGPNQLLTVGTDMAMQMNLAQAMVASEDQLRAVMNIRGLSVLRYDESFFESATRWLTQWWVRGLLFVGMLVLIYIELSHPGISVAGIGALICLILLVGAPWMTGLAQIWEILLIVLGLGLIVTDLILGGGLGLLAIPGFLLLAVGLVATFIPADAGGGFFPSTAAAYTGLQTGVSVLVFGSALSVLIFFGLARYLYMTPGFNRLQLAPSVGPPPRGIEDAAQRPSDEVIYPGSIGIVESDLRPAGKARFDTHLLDVVSQGEFIAAGTTVEVLESTGMRVVVRVRREA